MATLSRPPHHPSQHPRATAFPRPCYRVWCYCVLPPAQGRVTACYRVLPRVTACYRVPKAACMQPRALRPSAPPELRPSAPPAARARIRAYPAVRLGSW